MLRRSIKFIGLAAVAAAAISLIAFVTFLRSLDWKIGGPGMNDFVAPLAGGFDLWRTSSHVAVINRRHDPNHLDSISGDIVPSEVIDVGIQGDFITACQCVTPDSDRPPAKNDFRYWIIQVQEKKVIGPLGLSAFEAKCEEFGIESSPQSRTMVSAFRRQAGKTEADVPAPDAR